MTLRIEPYKRYSGGAKALSARIGVLRATAKQVRKHGTFDTIINWGNSERRFENAEYINDPEAVAVASDKLLTARRFGEAYIPQPKYTTDRACAAVWVDNKHSVLCRTLTRACGGRGIVLVNADGEPEDEKRTSALRDATGDDNSGRDTGRHRRGRIRRGRVLVNAPLYTRYVKKAEEYRVHVFDGQVIDVQRKRKRQEVPNEEVDYQIRSYDSGWVFCRDGVVGPDVVLSASIRAVSVLGLDFGAVDVGYNVAGGSCLVYEVNTAPGIEGTTLDKYYEAIQRRLPQITKGAYARRRQ